VDPVAVELEGHHHLGIGPVELGDEPAGVDEMRVRGSGQARGDQHFPEERFEP
jgi:hypothetical protein